MLVNILTLLLVLTVAGFYARSGLFSATISLVAAIFASILAMGLYEPASSLIAGYKPAYARGTTFLVIFFLALSACRLAADYAVPKTIKLSKLMDSLGGGIVGFFAGMVIIGSALLGLQMLPLHTQLLGIAGMGFDRFPAGMGSSSSPGEIATPAAILPFPADSFTLAVWNGASGRALGGDHPFDSVHPNLIVESYGYRNTVQYGASGVLPPSLFSVGGAYVTDDPAKLADFHISGDSKAAVVRIEVAVGTQQPKMSSDPDSNFRITPSEVRLVAKTADGTSRQYYPVGYLDHGTTFEPTPLSSGHFIDDYVDGKVVQDWVFQINRNEMPTWIEVKQLARADLSSRLSPKPFSPLASTQYPKDPYKFNHGSLVVTVTGESGPIAGAKVYLMPATTKVKNVSSAVQTAYNKITQEIQDINEGTPPWNTAAAKPGVPSQDDLRIWQRLARDNITLKSPGDDVSWSDVIATVLTGAAQPNGPANIASLPAQFATRIVPLLMADPADLRAQGVTDSKGRVELPEVSPGSYAIICSASTPTSYHCWFAGVVVAPKKQTTEDLSPKMGGFSLELKP